MADKLRDPRKLVMKISLGMSGLMLGGKLTAYFLTHSLAILSDASESVIHGAATGMAAFSLWYAEQPADRQYPYGHGKIVYFSAGFEGALILAVSVLVIYQSVGALIVGSQVQRLGLGVGLTAGLGLINLVLGLALVRVGKRHDSLILIANGKHVLSDMWTSLGAVVGLALVALTGARWLDPAAGLLIGVQILVTAVRLIRQSYFGLMDRVDPGRTEHLVRSLKRATQELPISGFHQLRHRETHDHVWAEVHLLVPGSMTTDEAHRVATEIEQRMKDAMPDKHDVRIVTHVEPADHTRAHPQGHDLPDPSAATIESIAQEEEEEANHLSAQS